MFLNESKITGGGSIRFLAFTMIVVIVSLLPLRQVMAATTWTVTVTYDSTAKDISYSVTSDNQDCGDSAPGPTNPLHNPPKITVCEKDTITFVYPGGNNELVIVVPDKILGDTGLFHTGLFRTSIKQVFASDGQAVETYVSGKAGSTEYEYYILAVDKTPAGAGTHCKDPKIMIGTGSKSQGQKK